MNNLNQHITISLSRVLFISALLLLFVIKIQAQESVYTIEFRFKDEVTKIALDDKMQFNSISECKLFSSQKIEQWRIEGYFIASIDSSWIENGKYINEVFLGPKSEEIKINTVNVNPQILKGKYWRGNTDKKFVQLKNLDLAKEQIADYYENEGYPFTEVGLDSLKFDGTHLNAQLHINLGDLVIFDTLIVKRKAPLGVHKKFFEAYLGLKKGDPFRQKNVDKATVIIEETPYLKLKGTPNVVFEYGKAMVQIPLEKQKASRADGIIGFAPNGESEGELLLTGQVMLDLWNPFGTGKRFYIDWKRPDNDSQWFSASYEHPRVFKSSFDFGYSINLQQQDSTFLKVINGLKLGKRVSTRGNLNLGISWESSRILRELTESDVDTLNDTQSTLYTVNYNWQNLDDPLSPRRGFKYNFFFTGGQRKVIYNPALSSDVYDGIPEKSALIEWKVNAEYYFGLTKWLEGFLKLEASQMIGDHLFKNELLRLGGFRSIRGFNEGELFVDRYAYITFEPRINMGDQSYLFVFTDIGISGVNDTWDTPIGFGAGVNISTKTGDFSIAYALGRTNEIPISTQLAKIHFGYIGKF